MRGSWPSSSRSQVVAGRQTNTSVRDQGPHVVPSELGQTSTEPARTTSNQFIVHSSAAVRTTQSQKPSSTRRRRAASDRLRLPDASAARSGTHANRANATIRAAYSGPTRLPLPSLGTMPVLTSRRRECLHTSINRRFGSSSAPGSGGKCVRATANSCAKLSLPQDSGHSRAGGPRSQPMCPTAPPYPPRRAPTRQPHPSRALRPQELLRSGS